MFRSDPHKQAIALAIVRVMTGIIFLMAGYQKFFLLGGHSAITGYFGQAGIPVPSVGAWIVMVLELAGGFLLMIGFLTRPVSALFAFEMLVAVVKVHLKNGFFLPQGYEFALFLMLISIGFAISGASSPSVDAVIAQRRAV